MILGKVKSIAEGEADSSGPCRRFLNTVNSVPEWADFGAMKRGQRLVAIFGPFMGISLFTGSLVGGAMFERAAAVTASTGQLGSDATVRRVSETAQMVISMALEDSLQPGAAAHETIVRVRLLHGALRCILPAMGQIRAPFDTKTPINQADLAITLALFGYLNLRSLALLGVYLAEEDVTSFMLMWRYVGYVLGIEEDVRR